MTTSSTWSFTTNYAPNAPFNPSPINGLTKIDLNPTLSVDVLDPDGDLMDVSFYNASDDSLIGTDFGVSSGNTASVAWSSLSTGTTYNWYAVADDGNSITTSLTWSFTTSYATNAPFNSLPIDGATGVVFNPTLSVDIFDPDGDLMDVSFYNASDNSLIGTDFGVSSGGTASMVWSGLSEGTLYSWYAVADDGNSMTTSSTWSFTTNYAPNVPFNPLPIDGATGVDFNPTLSVDVFDPDGDLMDVSFYNTSDDSLIGTDFGVSSGGTASVAWSGLSEGTSYSWYTVVDDNISEVLSPTWSFTVLIDIPIWEQVPEDQIIEYGDSFSYNLNATDLSGIDLWWINDTVNFNLNNNGVITSNGYLSVGEYSLDVRASDPYNNYCSAIISINIVDTIDPIWTLFISEIIIDFGENIIFDFEAYDLSGITSYWINDTINFNIDMNGVLTNSTVLGIGIYWLDVRAIDPQGNHCDGILKIVVVPPEDQTDTPAVSGYNILFFISMISLIGILLIRKQTRKKI